jgi:hypothetical protein
MFRSFVFVFTLIFLSTTDLYGQKKANEIFEASKGGWSAPVPKFKTIIDVDYRRGLYCCDRGDLSLSLITDSSYEVKAVHEGIVRAIFKIDSTYAIGINFGDYWIFYCGLEKPDVIRGDSVLLHQTIGTLYKEKDAEEYELFVLVMKHDKQIDASKWFRKLTNEIPDCNNPDMFNF